MAFNRKFLASGQLAAADATIYAPSGNLTGTIATLTFYNTSTTTQQTVVIYAPHTGTPGRILDKFVINPEKTYICRVAINQVLEGASSYEISGYATSATTVDYTCSGAEETS